MSDCIEGSKKRQDIRHTVKPLDHGIVEHHN